MATAVKTQRVTFVRLARSGGAAKRAFSSFLLLRGSSSSSSSRGTSTTAGAIPVAPAASIPSSLSQSSLSCTTASPRVVSRATASSASSFGRLDATFGGDDDENYDYEDDLEEEDLDEEDEDDDVAMMSRGEDGSFVLTASDTDVGLRLDAFISSRHARGEGRGGGGSDGGAVFPMSRVRAVDMIKSGAVTLNGVPVTKASSKLKAAGDIVTYMIEHSQRQRFMESGGQPEPEDIPISVVYEDEHLIVVDKTADMVVHPSCGHYTGTLVNALLHHCRQHLPNICVDEAVAKGSLPPEASSVHARQDAYMRPGIVHRLDKGTSGLLVVAKDEYSMVHLSEQFRSRSVKRTYTAVVAGVPREEAGKVESHIARDQRNRLRMAVLPLPRQPAMSATKTRSMKTPSVRGKYACSRYALVKTFPSGRASVMLWRLHTGRTHQIRVHAQHIGHPILGDDTYGGDGSCAISAFPCSREEARRSIQSLGRPALHATTLGFVHPVTGEEMFFRSDIPEDMVLLMHKLDDSVS